MKRTEKLLLFIAGIIAGLLLALVVALGPSDQDLDSAQYCQMVELHKADPSTGWPDFRNTYESECTHAEKR